MNKILLVAMIFFSGSVCAVSQEEMLKAIINPAATPNKDPATVPDTPKGKASIELENNENFRIEHDYSKEAKKSEQEKAMEAQEDREKTKQFKASYQKDKKCYEPETSLIRIQCANEYIKARAKFEEQYKLKKK